LHIHISCLRTDVRKQLDDNLAKISTRGYLYRVGCAGMNIWRVASRKMNWHNAARL
jgi:CDP-diacylglycerol pyrophosphatase